MILANDLYNLATDMANCQMGNKITKMQFRRNILKLVLYSIESSEYDPNFKKDLERLLISD